MRCPLKNVHNVGEETWPPVRAGNRLSNNDLVTRGEPYTHNPCAQAPSFPSTDAFGQATGPPGPVAGQDTKNASAMIAISTADTVTMAQWPTPILLGRVMIVSESGETADRWLDGLDKSTAR